MSCGGGGCLEARFVVPGWLLSAGSARRAAICG